MLCRICRRPLRGKKSQQLGVGPVCIKKRRGTGQMELHFRKDFQDGSNNRNNNRRNNSARTLEHGGARKTLRRRH